MCFGSRNEVDMGGIQRQTKVNIFILPIERYPQLIARLYGLFKI